MPTETINSPNAQQFADDEIVDGFGTPDDGVPMGLGGEAGKQSSPASSTLEADMAAQPEKPKQPPAGEKMPPDDETAGDEPPVQDAASEDARAQPAPKDEPETPEFPDTLLRMAGFSTAEDAKKAGFRDSETLLAAVQWRGQSLVAPVKPSRKSYLDSTSPETPPSKVPAETLPGEAKPKPLDPEIFDEQLLEALDERDKFYAARIEKLESQLAGRDENGSVERRAEQFDRAVQGLGKDWEDTFGKGDGDALFAKTDAEAVAAVQNRLDLFDAAEVVRRTNEEQGGKPLGLEQEIQWALMQRYPEKFRQQLLRDREAKASGRRGVQASRPTARKTPLGTKNERLLSALQTKYPSVDFSHGDNEIEGDI